MTGTGAARRWARAAHAKVFCCSCCCFRTRPRRRREACWQEDAAGVGETSVRGAGAGMRLDKERANGGGGGGRRWGAAPRKRPPPAGVGETSVRGVMEVLGEAGLERMGGRGGAGAGMHLDMEGGTGGPEDARSQRTDQLWVLCTLAKMTGV